MGSHVVILLQYFSFVTKRPNPLPISDSIDMIAMQRRNGNQTGTEETEAESLNGCGGSGRAGREGAAERMAAE